MLWSLLKILIFVALVAVLSLGVVYLLESDGGVQITVAGTEYTFGPMQSVIAAVVLLFAVWVFFKLASLTVASIRFLNGDETAISRYFDRNRERKGYKALTDGLMALASGEAKVAMAQASKAQRYLQKPEITNLLTAQAAEMAGDTQKATQTYKALIENQDTRFVGVRGIMKQKLAEGDTETARKLAEKAFAMKPKHQETQDVLLKLQAQAEDWAGARNTLNAKLKSGGLPRDVFTRRQAVLALSEAKGIVAEGASVAARERAIEANKLSPDLVPAAALAARAYTATGKTRQAARLLRKAWDAQPHPDLAAAFAEIEPNETPAARLKRFATLTSVNPDHMETRLLLAELNIVAEDFPAARRALVDLVEGSDGDARAFTLMAAAEKGAGSSDAVVQGWMSRALAAPRGPQWICDNCHHIHAEWQATCSSCESFDTLTWRAPPKTEVLTSTGANLLPFVEPVSKSEPAPEDAAAPAEPEEPPMLEAEVIETEGTPPAEGETPKP